MEMSEQLYRKGMMLLKRKPTLIRYMDKYNPRKVWLVKHYADGHYTLNQEICGRVFYSRFQRTTKVKISELEVTL